MSLSRRQLLCTAAAAAIAPALPPVPVTHFGVFGGVEPGTKIATGKFTGSAVKGGLASVRIGGVDYPLRGDIEWEAAHWEVAEPLTMPLPSMSLSGTLTVEQGKVLDEWRRMLIAKPPSDRMDGQ